MPTALRKYTLALVASCLWVNVSAAQARTRCAPTADSLAKPCELDSWPLTRTAGDPPAYPTWMRINRVLSDVHAEYEVDTSGRALPSTLRIRGYAHELFSASVRNAIAQLRFQPPRREGAPVRVRVNEVIHFDLPSGSLDSTYIRASAPRPRFEADSTGTLQTTIIGYLQFDSLNAPRLMEEDRLSIYTNAADNIVRQLKEPGPQGTLCIEFAAADPPAAVFERWASIKRAVVPYSRCPREYSTYIIQLDSADRAPPGWVNPTRIRLHSLLPWARNVVLLQARILADVGSGGWICEVARGPDGWTDVGCIQVMRSMG